jgi:hypothetical protein
VQAPGDIGRIIFTNIALQARVDDTALSCRDEAFLWFALSAVARLLWNLVDVTKGSQSNITNQESNTDFDFKGSLINSKMLLHRVSDAMRYVRESLWHVQTLKTIKEVCKVWGWPSSGLAMDTIFSKVWCPTSSFNCYRTLLLNIFGYLVMQSVKKSFSNVSISWIWMQSYLPSTLSISMNFCVSILNHNW